MSRIEQVESLFHEALALPPGVDRTPWIEARCTGDDDLLREVLTLLEAHAEMKRVSCDRIAGTGRQ